jgi:hypothetical protein
MMTLADAIIAENIALVREVLSVSRNVNMIDEYGFTPLVEAAIADNVEIAALLIQHGADVNLRDTTGSTALHWAAENNNLRLVHLLLENDADPNAYTYAGQPVLVMPVLRQQSMLKKFLIDQGADLEFAQDFINTKLLGHMFELVGTANIISPSNQYVEVDFEGFFIEVSLGIISDSVEHFKNHFAARQMRRYSNISQTMIDVFQRGLRLVKLQQYRNDIEKNHDEITALIQQEPVLIPVGYEGHAITFIKFGSIWVKCDRREDSRHYDNIMIYQVGNKNELTVEFIKHLVYEKQSDVYINTILPQILQLTPITELKVAAQISGNCSWANVEACIPTLHFLLSANNPDFQENISQYKSQALKYFHQWREWNKDRALNFCIQSLKSSDSIRRVCKAEILAAILFQCCNNVDMLNRERAEMLVRILSSPEYDYILQNYIKAYSYEDQGEEGRNFLTMLRDYGYKPPRR